MQNSILHVFDIIHMGRPKGGGGSKFVTTCDKRGGGRGQKGQFSRDVLYGWSLRTQVRFITSFSLAPFNSKFKYILLSSNWEQKIKNDYLFSREIDKNMIR